MPSDSSIPHTEATEEEVRMVHQTMDRLKSNPYDERFRYIAGSYLFDVDQVGTWRVSVDHGKIQVFEGAHAADCIIRTSAMEFAHILKGERNLLTAFMRGEVEVEGDLALAQKLLGIVPAPIQGRKQPGGAS